MEKVSHIGRLINIVKRTISLKLISSLNPIPIETPAGIFFFNEIDRLIQKLIWKCNRIAKKHLEKEEPRGAVLRWQRNRMGRPLSPSQIHRKII